VKMRQYAEGRKFVHAVVERVSMDGFNKIWQSPLTIPRLDELSDPDAWVVRVLGAAWFGVLYVSAVVVAFVPTTLRHMGNPKYASLGASGAVAAVMFSAILLHPALKMSLAFLPLAIPAPLYALGYLAYSAWRSLTAGRRDAINHDAHFAGALYGVAFTFLLEPARATRAVQHLF